MDFRQIKTRPAAPADDKALWMRYAGLVESGDPTSSLSIDEVVYGSEPAGDVELGSG